MSHLFHALAHRVDEWRAAGYPSADYPAVREVLDFAIEDAAHSKTAGPVCVISCAALYGVPTKALNQAIKRNAARFPADFMFRLSDEEHGALRSQVVTSKPEAAGRGGRRSALDELDRKLSTHDQAIAGLIDAIRQLTASPARQSRPIGFTADLTRR